MLSELWSRIVWLFEKADIIPPIIAVSVWHYAGALAEKDPLPVAVVIGVLVDIGHYRAVKTFFRRHTWSRFALMAVFTVLTGWYHFLWYDDVLLALGMPVLIIGLAILSIWEGWEKQGKTHLAQPALHAPQENAEPTHACGVCGNTYAKQQSLAAHMRVHLRNAAKVTESVTPGAQDKNGNKGE